MRPPSDLCCECGKDITDKPEEVTVCDKCKDKRMAEIHERLQYTRRCGAKKLGIFTKELAYIKKEVS